MDQEELITEEEFQTAITFATQTKNKCSRYKGYPPELLVFGKLSKCPGSVINNKGNRSTIWHYRNPRRESNSVKGLLFANELARPLVKLTICNPCAEPCSKDRDLKDRSTSQETGPLRVVLQEDKNVIWAVQGNKLFSLAPEHARSLSAVEEIQNMNQAKQVDMPKTLEQIRSGNTRYVSLHPSEIPVLSAPRRSNDDPEPSQDQPHTEPDASEKMNPSQPRS